MFPKSKILFTPFMISIDYIKDLLKHENIEIVIDSIELLEENKEIFKNSSIGIRINCTADELYSGCPLYKIEELFKLIEILNINVIGLHTHVPSKLFNNETYHEIGDLFLELIKKHKDLLKLEWIDLGGGLPVYTGWEKTKRSSILDISKLSKSLKELKSDLIQYFPKCHIRIEPGRYLISDTCLFISTISNVYFYIN